MADASGGLFLYTGARRVTWTLVSEVIGVRITLADERSKVRFALRALLQRQADLEVVGEAANAQELIALVEHDCTDLILIDCELPGRELPDLLHMVRGMCPDAMIIALSGRVDARPAAQKAGADAFVSKGDPPDRLLSAIHSCAQRYSGL
jgi:DNA-binding NarL/FixJ family response regulator